MSVYPYGTASTGVFEIFNTNFSPNDVVRAIRDNYSPVNRTTMLNSLGYQVGLVQNFVNSTYLGRREVPVQNAYMYSGWAEGSMASYSGLVSDSTHYYSRLFPTYIDVKSKTGSPNVCGHTFIRPHEIEFREYNSSNILSGFFNFSGILLDRLVLTMPSTLNSLVSTWSASKAHKLTIANYSATQSTPLGAYSGILELTGNELHLYSRGTTRLGSSYLPNLILEIDAIDVTFSGLYNYSNILTTMNVIPTVHGERSIGDDTRYWEHAYIQKMESTAQMVDGISPTKQYGFYGIFGALCGANYSGMYGVDLRIDHVCGTAIHNRAAMGPNRILLARYETGVTNTSGYFWVNDNGQLEFYKVGSSGWVLTAF